MINDVLDIYCLNFNSTPDVKNEQRIEMEKKFEYFNIQALYYSGVMKDDERLRPVENDGVKKSWSICYGHLDMICHFATTSSKEYAIFCEDDILIRKDFIERITAVTNILRSCTCDTQCYQTNRECNGEKKYNFDLILLGYLCYNPIHKYPHFVETKTEYSSESFKLLEYTHDTWGTQMYLLSKQQAVVLLQKYYFDYAVRTLSDETLTPFSADWLITKDGKRAALYPLVVIENNKAVYDDFDQMDCRIKCYDFSFKPDTFI